MKEATSNERKTAVVLAITIVAMGAEIAFGYITGSMALLADGLHMGTHALAMILALAAFFFIRKYAGSKMFAGGTDKIGDLAGFASSIFLATTGVWIVCESLWRLFEPQKISFDEAIIVAAAGLAVNLACIAIMGGAHISVHGGKLSSHTHNHSGADNNFTAVYLHILADALTSVLAIAALFAAKYLQWNFADAIVGILGGYIIIKWAIGLIKRTATSLLDIRPMPSQAVK